MTDLRYRFLDRGFTWFSWLAALAVLGAVGIFLGFLGLNGLATLDLRLFFGEASPWQVIWGSQPAGEGLWPACVGTIYLVVLSSLLAIPLGVAFWVTKDVVCVCMLHNFQHTALPQTGTTVWS